MARKEGGTGLANIEDSVDKTIIQLANYIKTSKTRTTQRSTKQQYLGNRNGKKAIVWIFQVTNKRNLTREDLDVAKKGKPSERNRISSNSSTKQYYVKPTK